MTTSTIYFVALRTHESFHYQQYTYLLLNNLIDPSKPFGEFFLFFIFYYSFKKHKFEPKLVSHDMKNEKIMIIQEKENFGPLNSSKCCQLTMAKDAINADHQQEFEVYFRPFFLWGGGLFVSQFRRWLMLMNSPTYSDQVRWQKRQDMYMFAADQSTPLTLVHVSVPHGDDMDRAYIEIIESTVSQLKVIRDFSAH